MRRILVRPRRLGTPVVLCVAIATFAALAVNSQGFPVQHVSLNDGGIWVTNNAIGAIGRFDKPIAQLDGQVDATSAAPNLDVYQNGGLVAAWDQSAGRLYSVDVYKPDFAGGGAVVSVASTGDIALGGSTLAVLGEDHTLRTTTLDTAGGSLAAVASGTAARASHLPSDAAVAVAADNTVYVAAGRELRRFPPGDAGPPDVSSLPLAATDALQVATVGNVPVVADQTTRTLYLPGSGRTVPLPSTDTSNTLELQQSSTSSSIAVVATTDALYAVDLATGRRTTLSSHQGGNVAQPVQVAGCVHAVWYTGGSGAYVRSCGGQAPTASYQQSFPLNSADPSLVFRVNRGEVVLNDTANGGVFLVDTKVVNAKPKWQQRDLPNQRPNNNQNNTTDLTQAPLIARPDTQGVRAGRTTVVHVLDNDSGPSGRPLAVTAVSQPDQPDVTVTIAPDAQTVLATVGAEGLSGDAHFQYTIDDGRGRTAQAQVTLVPRDNEQNSAPALRHDYTPPSLDVTSGASLKIPVIGDWRDFDGDPLYVDSGDVSATAGSAGVTSGGALTYTAPQATSSLTATIRFGISDGIVARPTQASLTVHVLAASSTQPVPPVAEPDVAQAIVGMPVTLQPLANDLPGADPTNPQAHLTLAAPVGTVPGAVVSTDLGTGTVTFTAERPGPFFLTYQAAYGAAQTSRGTIRVQASPATGKPKPPVATPDVAVIHGQQPALVDVLANDYDPQGWVLGVVGASSTDPALQATVVDQHWLRISSDDPQPGATSTVSYTVSDGRGTATGTVSVSAVPAAAGADQITTQDDSVVIRAGDSAAVPVLANDTSSTGLPLTLDQIAPTATPPIPGLTASDQGQDVRVTVPGSVPTEEETTVSYVATDASGAAATGHLDVTIEPGPPSKAHPDQAPSPHEVDTRETAGDVETIHIPTYGIDPDGDSTAVTAVTVPPALGRIVSIGPNTITYQSYPTSSGTDVFTYQVTDPYGATGTAQVRVGILPPGPPQPPIAVDNVVNAPPGAALSVDVLANNYVAAGDQATVVPLAETNRQLPAGVHLAGSVVYLRAPARVTDAPLEFTYGITDGSSAPSLAQVIVRAVAGAKLPPIANDDIAPLSVPGAATVTVDVLSNDVDPTGTPGDLRISGVPAGVTIRGGSLTIPVEPLPREVPYKITAPDKLTATAVVDVPGTSTSRIRLKPGARIKVNRHGSVNEPLSAVLTDTAGRPLQITTIDRLAASPGGDISVDAHQSTVFTVNALGDYAGPGAVTVQVYDGTSLQDRNGETATVTIPVQVGPDVPLMRCPSGALPVIEGGNAQTYDIGLLCHVWVDTTIVASPPRYTLAWVTPVGGVSAKTTVNGLGLILSAGPGARPGATGTLRITPAGSTAGGVLSIEVTAAPLPTGRAVTAQTTVGRAVTVDLSQYVTSPLPQPRIQVLSVTRAVGASVRFSGSDVTVTPTADTHRAVALVASVTDVPGRTDRLIHVAITVNVVGPPGAPGEPSASVSDHTIVVSFSPAPDNGAPIDHYTVFTNGAPHVCLAAPCTVTGLANTTYDVYVTAHNSSGNGPPSGHIKATPDQVPDQVNGLKATPSDADVSLSWHPAVVDGSPVKSYTAEISPAPSGQSPTVTLGASATSTTFAGLTNGTTYSFRVEAVNAQGPGPWSVSVTAVPFGKPPQMPAPAAAGAAVPNPATTRAITVSWGADDDNGSQISDYTVTEYKSTSSGGPWTVASTVGPEQPGSFGGGSGSYQQSFTVNNDGTWYEYTITATNAAGASPESSKSSSVQGAAPPDAPANLSALDHPSGSDAGYNGAIHVDFTVPEPNSAQLSSVEYGINATSVSGTWNSPGTPGASVDESIGGLTNGTGYAVYVRGCNDAGLCGPWAGPSGQVTPYGPPNPPTVSAQQNGTSITFSWSGGGGNGRPVSSYYVCFDGGSCESTGANSVTKSYGNSQTHTVTAYVVDSAGQQSSTANASATTVAASPSVKVVEGPSETSQIGNCTTASICHAVDFTVSNFPAGATLRYACSDNGGQFWPTSGTITATVSANGSGSASFQTQCIWGFWTSAGHTLTVTVNGTSGSISG